MLATFQLWYWITMPFCIPYSHSDFHLFYSSACWSCSISSKWDVIVFCWLASYFPYSKIQIFAFNYSHCSHNSIASCSAFFTCDSVFFKRSYNSMPCFSMALAFNFATCDYIGPSISNPNPHFSMTFIRHHWGYLGSQLGFASSGMMNVKEVESMKSTLHVVYYAC